MLPTEKDELAPSEQTKIHRLEKPRKTWFFERHDGSIVAVGNDEAFFILKGNNNYHRTMKMIGCSDGVTFHNAVVESHNIFRTTQDIKLAQEKLREGERAEIEKARGNMERPIDPQFAGTRKSP
jgi:hypothetical protein